MKTSGFRGKIGRTVAESEPWWSEDECNIEKRRPNIVTVVFDDTGWSDFGCYGSEIRTPTIDALAERGLRYSNFHVTPMCSPTRAALMAGRNHHRIGMRCLADTDTGFPNGRGSIPPDVPLLPRLLRDRGYGTYMVGKWHLTPAHEITPAGPHLNWPLSRGFDRYYGFLGGCTDHYAPELIQDNHMIEPPARDGYHLTEDLCDRAIVYLRDHAAFRRNEPAYLNVCFGATHAPLQVERRYIDPYIDVFEKGWDRVREDRLARQKAMGLAPAHAELTPRNPEVPAWETLSVDQKRLYTRLQAAFAGFLEHADEQLGRIVAELKRLGMYENTVIMVISDNGASREGGQDGAVDVNAPYSGKPETVEEMVGRLDEIGGPTGPAHYPEGWAMAGSTPFRRYKQFVELGGIRSPLVVNWPAGIKAGGGVRGQFLHVIDLAPTLLELTGSGVTDEFDGKCFRDTFDDAGAQAPRNEQHWEMFGRRAVYADGWRAVSSHEKGDDYERDEWRLYDTRTDFSECTDVAFAHPEKLDELRGLWWREAERNDVMPLDDRTLVDVLDFRQPNGLMARREITLYSGQGHVPQISMITSSERSMEITAHFTGTVEPGHPGGVLVSSGDSHGGYTFYIKKGRLWFEHIKLGRRTEVSAPLRRAITRCSVVVHVGDHSAATAILFADCLRLSECRIPAVATHLSFWGLDVGRDAALPVSTRYQAPFAFPEAGLDRVVMRFFDDVSAQEIAAALEAAE
ncbi:arylsulfatase [Mesorhizobium marinum]|uniref:arylsulfatase n=1 Tax=Mesorhizobium marinum TaxID=3228790 RepID=UPI0034653405